MRIRLIAALIMVGLTLMMAGPAQAASCPPYFFFGCNVKGYGANGLIVETTRGTINDKAIFGYASASTGATIGVYGRANAPNGRGVRGYAGHTSGFNYGVQGETVSTNGVGVVGQASASSGSTRGVLGLTSSSGGTGVYGYATASSGFTNGVVGRTQAPNGAGVLGVAGALNGTTYGVYGASYSPNGYGGYFVGRVRVFGSLSVTGAKSFVIDHPLDPANKYLYHAAIEAPELLNVYSGNTTTDANGEATVALPDYFEALNRDFRYQLTPVGQFAQPIVGREIAGNQFTIKTDKPNVKVSWQVTGVRNDAYAQAHPLQVEVEKPQGERGTYLTPKEHGQPESRGVGYDRQQLVPANEALPEETATVPDQAP